MFEPHCHLCSIIFNNVKKNIGAVEKNEFVNDKHLCEFNEGLNICCHLNPKPDCR